MKLKILHLFVAILSAQFTMCAPSNPIKPNNAICTVSQALSLYRDTVNSRQTDLQDIDDYKEHVLKQVERHRKNTEDWGSLQAVKRNSDQTGCIQFTELDDTLTSKIIDFLRPEPFRTSDLYYQFIGIPHNRKWHVRQFFIHLYMGLADNFDFIQGENGVIYLPGVMPDGTVQMIKSDMEFEIQAIDKPDGGKEITASIRDKISKLQLAESFTTINKDGLCSEPTKFMWTGHRVTKETIDEIRTKNPQVIDDQNRVIIHNCPWFNSLPNRSSRSLIEQSTLEDIILEFDGIDATDSRGYSALEEHKFVARHIIAYQLSAFALICQSVFENQHSYSRSNPSKSDIDCPLGSELKMHDILSTKIQNIASLSSDIGFLFGYGPCITAEYRIKI